MALIQRDWCSKNRLKRSVTEKRRECYFAKAIRLIFSIRVAVANCTFYGSGFWSLLHPDFELYKTAGFAA